jgi:hypothetical protein
VLARRPTLSESELAAKERGNKTDAEQHEEAEPGVPS